MIFRNNKKEVCHSLQKDYNMDILRQNGCIVISPVTVFTLLTVLRRWSRCLTFCCFMVYSTRRFVLCLTLCYFVLVLFSPFSTAITSLGEERANFSAFRTFV